MSTDPRYPIGKLERRASLTPEERAECIRQIAATPAALAAAVSGLTADQLDTPYREGGWTLRQVVHHLPDSHANAYVRFKLALTEENPTIKPYDENGWAGLADVRDTPVETSIRLLEALHERWVVLLRSLTEPDFTRPLLHPDNGPMNIDMLLNIYAWHGRHHVAHITGTRDRNGW